MKKDNLERFVRDNREAFDDREPPADLWQRINTGLGGSTDAGLPTDSTPTAPTEPEQAGMSPAMPFTQIHRNTRTLGQWFTNWQAAAAVVVLLLAGSAYFLNHRYGVASHPEVAVAAGPTYAKEVAQYTRLIDTKRMELRQMTESNPALYEEFATDLNRLERSYKSLKADLPKNPNQELLIQAMIQNLQIQINLLNEQLRVIQRINQQTHENPV
ncbi:hypothetical protein [Spirosoma rhododendri]|uniref:Anti-sigma factor n=1 Tax=Spirosoma rhododendri TaxID=2728024 RepID=A0A7L5DP24_9BACT|nr:hypothetical protein [Spirosoma rhododendri]QJD78238.1 hypothetical protein HH216_07220 [Spirosoma rhododendri]